MRPRETGLARAAPWLAALAGTWLTLTVFWPGYTSIDSLHQYRQALAGSYDNVHPPLFAFAWRHLDRLVAGSGAMHALLVAGFWTGLARTLWAIPMGARARVAAFAAIGLWPPVLLMIAHVWKDVAMAAALLLACGACLRWRDHARRRDAVAAVAWLALAVAMRHNAWPAALPFIALLFHAQPRPRFHTRRVGAPFAAIALACVLATVPWMVESALGAERKRLWPTVALWDLAAVSIATGEVRLPREVAPTITLADLAAHYRSWSCVPLYDSGKIRLALHVPYTDADARAVDRAWLEAVRDAPGPYLAHRARVLAGLYLSPPRDAPRELVYVPEQRVGGEQPDFSGVQRAVLGFAAALWATPLFAWLSYLAVAIAAFVFARRGARAVPAALLASSVLYAAPLALVAASAEYRYVFWSVLAALLSAVASLGSRSGAARDVALSERGE